jgi:hypothetical protein
MRTLLLTILLAAFVAGCGASEKPAATPRPDPLAGYSEGVRNFYGGAPLEAQGDPDAGVEAEYHQPPVPAEAKLGGTITLTGTNIGVRLRVTVTGVERRGSRVAVSLKLANDGIAVYEAPLDQAAVTYGDGAPVKAVGSCQKRFAALRLDVSRHTSGCLLFPASGDALPERLQLALETVPVEAGGIWNLT